MKQKLKKIKFLLTLSLLGLLLFSCNKDEDNSVLDSKGVFHKQYNDILKEEKFANAVSKLTKNSTQNSASAKSYSSSQNITTLENQFGFTIANQEVNVATNDTLTSYTMLINREVEIPNEFENLIILIDNNSNTTAFVLKYSDNVPVSYTNLQNQSSQKQVLSTNFVYCVEYQVWTCNYPGHTESGVCTHGHWETFSICSSSGGSSSGTSGTGGAGSGSNSSTSVTSIPTATVGPTVTQMINSFVLSLSPQQQLWWNNPANTDSANKIKAFLAKNFPSIALEDFEFAKDMIDLISLEISVDQNALSFMLKAKTQDKINNALDEAFLLSVDQYIDVDASIAGNNGPIPGPVSLAPLISHFSIQCAAIRAKNPTWSNLKIYWEASKEFVHIILDVYGLVPVIGEVADLANGVLYAIDGDGVNATISVASAVPIYGWAAVSTKYAVKIKTAYATNEKVKLVWKVLPNGDIFFASDNYCRAQLRKVLGLAVGNPLIAHHIMPIALQTQMVIQRAAKSSSAFHLNEALNGIPLNSLQHTGNHAVYSQKIFDKLEDFKRLNPNATPIQCYNYLVSLINDIKAWILAHPNTDINLIVLP